MGRFVNPDNSAFQVALNSKIYIDKTGLIACMNDVLTQQTDIFAIVVHAGLENHMRRICLQHTIAKVQIRKRCFLILR